MKFYIISASLNIALLFIPVTLPVINSLKQDNVPVITVNLENSVFEEVKERKGEESKNIEKKQEKTEKNFETKKNNENTVIQEKNEKKNNEIKISHSENKKKVHDNKLTNTETTTDQTVSALNTGSGNEIPSKKGKSSTESKNNFSEGKEKGNEQSQIVKKSSGGNVCRENIDYTVVYNPNLQYPMAAERLGVKKPVIVNVKINFNGNGSVSVIGVSGGEGIFRSEAKKAAGKIKVKIKNPETLKCTITKPFRFNPR